MLLTTDVAHEYTDLAVVDLAPVAAPWPFHPYRMRAPLGKAPGIKGDDALGFPHLIGYLPNQHAHQRAMIPGGGANELLQDQALDIDQRRDVLGIFAGQVGQQPLEVEMHVALAGLGLERVLIGHDERTQTVHHVMEHVGGHDAVTQQFLLT
ncbi:MAG TPA: hypothetical protein VLQ80_09725, partial [Candidatus Saccharimonadia bacterium]|nr:hypothetical protein [Candidatus Saccharimonadia bacterium]